MYKVTFRPDPNKDQRVQEIAEKLGVSYNKAMDMAQDLLLEKYGENVDISASKKGFGKGDIIHNGNGFTRYKSKVTRSKKDTDGTELYIMDTEGLVVQRYYSKGSLLSRKAYYVVVETFEPGENPLDLDCFQLPHTVMKRQQIAAAKQWLEKLKEVNQTISQAVSKGLYESKQVMNWMVSAWKDECLEDAIANANQYLTEYS